MGYLNRTMGVDVANKVLSALSAIISLSLTAICIWTLVSLIADVKQKDIQEKCNDPNNILVNRKDCDRLVQGPTLEDEYHEAIVINGKKMPTSKSSEYYAKFEDMNETFRLIILICICGTIGASLVQFLCSVVIVFSPSFRVAARSRKIVGVLFLTFILYLIAFGSPLACRREKDAEGDQWHTMTTLNSFLKDFFMKFGWEKLDKDLNLYYINLFINTIFLFLYMVVTCCLLRWAEYEDYDI